MCYPELEGDEVGETQPFGYNWTHPTLPMDATRQFTHFSSAQLGGNPAGQVRAVHACRRSVQSWGRGRGGRWAAARERCAQSA